MTAFRIGAEDLAEIDRRAESLGMSRTQFMIDASLGRLSAGRDTIQPQLDELRRRVDALERASAG